MNRWLAHGVLLALATGCGSTDGLQRFEYVEMAMASPARLVLYAESEASASGGEQGNGRLKAKR